MSEETNPISEVQDVPKAPRRGRPTLAQMTAGQDPVALEKEMEEDRRLALVEEKYGDDMPFDQHRLENEIVFYFKQSANAYFEAGRRLVRLKEHVGHGMYYESLQRIGISEDVAQRTMFTVRKFIEAGITNPATARDLSPSKLYEIALLEPADIAELGAGGTVAGRTLDDLERMTVREIKETFRKEREDRKAKDAAREEVIKAKNDKIDELERQLRGTPERSPREKAQIALYDYKARFLAACYDLRGAIGTMREYLADAARVPGLENDQVRQFANELIDQGTEAVINDWETMTDELSNLVPIREAKDVRALG